MTTYFISRHPGAIAWAERQNIKIDCQSAHLDIALIQSGDTVIGSLPVNLAAEVCAKHARYVHLSLDLPFNARGVELDADAMHLYGAKFEEYLITRVNT